MTSRVRVAKHATVVQARDTDGSFVAIKLASTVTGGDLVDREIRLLQLLDTQAGPLGTQAEPIATQAEPLAKHAEPLAAYAELLDRQAPDGSRMDADLATVPARLIDHGTAAGRRYLASRWISGIEVRVAAAEVREARGSIGAVEIAGSVTRAYADLHAAGVLHGQVHPRHALADRDGSVSLLDLSVGATAADAAPAARPAVRFNSLSAPEQAAALLRGDELETTAAAEQYSVAALLYLLITGRVYAQLRLERRDLATDILAKAPLPFAELGVPAWPQLEAALARALEKDPVRRYPSVNDLRRALGALRADATAPVAPLRLMPDVAPSRLMPDVAPSRPMPDVARTPTRRRPGNATLADLLDTFRREAGAERAIGGLPAPTCSITYGAAGVAFALTRLGKLTGDHVAFELAERWLSAAERDRSRPDAFDDGDELTPDTVGLVSPFHNSSGLAAVRAFLSDATGDRARHAAALDDFRDATRAPCANLDLTLGRSSVLLVAALLYARSPPDWPSAQRLASYGDELSAGILAALDHTKLPYHGIAHGSAGVAYAVLMWARARAAEPDAAVRDVLGVLADVAEPHQRGARWPLTPAEDPAGARYWPGWCHGNAGYVFLWNLAQLAYPGERFGELADRAAWLADATAGVSSLCCGSAGQIYAALNHYRSTNDAAWRDRAHALARRSATQAGLAADSKTPLSLYKGHVGLALLAVEIERPSLAAMPLFEFEPAP